MSPGLVVALVVVGLGVVVVRRRSVAIFLVALQSLLLGIGALTLAHDRSADHVVAGIVLIVKAGALPALLLFTVRRTRETRLVAAAAPAAARLMVAGVLALAIAATAPTLGLDDPAPARGAFALVAVGIAIVVLRRPALFQALGLFVAENGVYLLAVSAPGGMPFVVELGVLFDLALVLTVALGFTHRIHAEFGSSDTDRLRGLRD